MAAQRKGTQHCGLRVGRALASHVVPTSIRRYPPRLKTPQPNHTSVQSSGLGPVPSPRRISAQSLPHLTIFLSVSIFMSTSVYLYLFLSHFSISLLLIPQVSMINDHLVKRDIDMPKKSQ